MVRNALIPVASENRSQITIRHPAYSTFPILLQLPGDYEHQSHVYFPLVHTACAIIACNRFDGYISTSSDPTIPPASADGDYLELNEYFFHVPGTFKYPVFLTFRNWSFPHGASLNNWLFTTQQFSNIWTNRCAVTGHLNALEKAHIVPKAEYEWFNQNRMPELDPNWRASMSPIQTTNLGVNMLDLRADIHALFDKKEFMFFPKTNAQGGTSFVLSCRFNNGELIALYHDRAVTIPPSVSPQCLFARFAWSLFPVFSMNASPEPVLIRIRNRLAGGWTDQELTSEQLFEASKRETSRSSAKTRSASAQRSPSKISNKQGFIDVFSGIPERQALRKQRRRHSDSGFGGSSEDAPFIDDDLFRGRPLTRRLSNLQI